MTEFLSLIIAFIALLATIWELRENRDYNKISIRPLLVITQHFGGSQGRYGIAVKNAGLGPAIINKCEVTIGSNKMKENDGDHGWNAAKKELKLKRPIELIESKVAPNGKIAHGDRIWLLYIGDKSINNENIVEVQNAIKNSGLDVKINYESMFGEPFTEVFLKKERRRQNNLF